jgi:hypothetical protein
VDLWPVTRKQNHRDFTFKEQIKFQHLFYGNSKPDNVLCILFVTGHKSTIVMQDFLFFISNTGSKLCPVMPCTNQYGHCY